MGRFGHAILSLILGLAVIEVAVGETAPVSATPLDQAQFLDWSGHQHQLMVNDGSILTKYQGVTEASNRSGMLLTISFSPRFSCTPVIAFQMSDNGVELASASEFSPVGTDIGKDTGELPDLGDNDLLDLRVDGAKVNFPLIVDFDDEASWFFNGNGRERETLRMQLDLGEQATVAIAEDRNVVFSLLGSRKTLETLEELCQRHDPIPLDN